MKKTTVKIEKPILIAGKEVSEICLRSSTVGDEEDAMQQAVQLKRSKNNVTIELCLFAKLTRIPYDVLRTLQGPDYQKLRDALNEMNGAAADAEEDENPLPQTTG